MTDPLRRISSGIVRNDRLTPLRTDVRQEGALLRTDPSSTEQIHVLTKRSHPLTSEAFAVTAPLRRISSGIVRNDRLTPLRIEPG